MIGVDTYIKAGMWSQKVRPNEYTGRSRVRSSSWPPRVCPVFVHDQCTDFSIRHRKTLKAKQIDRWVRVVRETTWEWESPRGFVCRDTEFFVVKGGHSSYVYFRGTEKQAQKRAHELTEELKAIHDT